jgi:cytochrome c oxidase cbb3-type subunit 1
MQAEAVNPRLVKFIWAAAIFFAWAMIQGAVITQEPVRLFVEAGPGSMISMAKTHVGLLGWMSLALMATLYYIVPLISGKSIVCPKLIEWIFWIFVVCGAAAGALMTIAGVVGGNAFAAGVTGAQLEAIIMPYAMPGGLLCTICVIAALMFVVQILVSLARGSKASS